MNLSPQQYSPYYQPYSSTPMATYWTDQFQAWLPVVVSLAVMVAVGAWALSLVKKALKGEEVKFPL
jgi:hypothetical protein